jgi:hypothetical protein
MMARVWPISHFRSSRLFGASVLIFAVLLFSLQLAPGQTQQGSLGQFTQQGSKLVGTGSVGSAEQGSSVALSGDGNTVIVGGPNDNGSAGNQPGAGAAWVFTQSGGVWSQQGSKLLGTGAVGNAQQGMSVALSGDGNTAIVGGPYDNASAGNNSGAGAAWVFIRSASGVWSQQGSKLVGTGAVGNAQQGISVALSADGNTAIVGAPGDNSQAGAAWVFTRSASGVWSQQGSKLVGTGAVGGAHQGISVALSADGNTAIVGGPSDNSWAGAAWVFTRSSGVWTQQGSKLVGTGGVTAAQGWSVALSGDGNTGAVGGPGDNSRAGATWVFTRIGGLLWSQQGSKLVGTGAIGSAVQGASVALSGNGNSVIVGGYGDSSNAGASWIFTRSSGVWTQQGSKLAGTGTVGAAFQGSSVTLSGDGNTAIVGGYGDNSNAGAAWVFVQPATTTSSSTQPQTASSTSKSPGLQVTPSTNIVASGPAGGPFSPSTFSYRLTASQSSIPYMITNAPNWLTASSIAGIATKSGKTITFSTNTLAKSLKPGTYTGNFYFNNTGYLATLTVAATQYTIAVSASPSAGGTVSGGGTFAAGSSQTVTATANSGFSFVNWTANGSAVSTSAGYPFTLSSNVTLVANFTSAQQYTIGVSASPSAGGTVSGGGTFAAGSSRTVTATGNSGYRFVNWTQNGSVVSTLASYPFTLNGNTTLVANFTPAQYTIAVSASPSADGTVSGGGTFAAGSSQTVTATAKSGFSFVNWTANGSVASTSSSYTFTLNNNTSLVANFAPTQYTVAVSASPSAGGIVSSGGTFAAGSSITVTATANNGYSFVNWTQNGSAVSTLASYPFTLNSNVTLVANFTPVQYTIAVSASPSGGGTVSGGGTFAAGSSRTLTATASSGFSFVNWTANGSVVSTSASYAFTLNSNVTLVANFTTVAPPQYTIAVSASPSADGTVSGAGTFAAGSSPTVTATANSGFSFVNWTANGSVVSTLASYTFTLNSNVTLVANFTTVAPPQYTVAVSASPGADGTVSGGGTFVAGNSDTVTATANNGFSFVNWTANGSVVSSTSSYTFTPNGNISLVANFTAVTVASIILSNTTVNAAAGSVVGTVSVTTNPPGGTYSGVITLGGANASSFALTNGGVLPCNLVVGASNLTAGTYAIMLSAQ